jgi:outer membrane receptor protein involved in Fe transport
MARRMDWLKLGLPLFVVVSITRVSGQSADLLPEMVVLAGRLTDPAGTDPVAEWSHEEILEESPRAIDEVLSREPSFSLYRRQSSVFGNPSAAGVSLRNTGATAASRTLVLLDGVPQNDPFGGWVYWARYDAAALDSVRIVPSSQSAVWGNQSPAGVVQMNSNPAFENRHILKLGGGSQGSVGGSTYHQMTNEEKTRSVAFSAFGFHTDGFYALSPTQRGPVDEKLRTDLWGANLRGAWLAAPGLTVEPSISWYTEDRCNGTELSENSTDALDLSLRVTSDDGDHSWQALGWFQDRTFESVFSSVNEDRSEEVMALDQYDVPGQGAGGSFTMRWDGADRWTITTGTDFRWVTGETNEDAGVFRTRSAGGDQAFEGIFVSGGYKVDDLTRVDGSLRMDAWQIMNGHRREVSLTDGSVLRDEYPEDRDGFEPSASIELKRDLSSCVVGRVSTGTAFRLPTLNELYRPFRVRNDVTEANPDLDPERFFSVEGGLDWKPAEDLTVSASVFHHWIKDAIANVPVTDPAKITELFGVLPPGGTGAQKQNVDLARVLGVEGRVEWLPHKDVTLELAGLWSDTEFSDSPEQPALEGNPFPQAPDLRLIAGGEWRANEKLSFFGGVEYGSSQYDDALATREISDFTSVRIGASYRHGNALYQIRVENLFDEEIETGVSGDGLRTLAAPRSLWAGVTLEF